MKRIILGIAVMTLSLNAMAQSGYEKAMAPKVEIVNSSMNVDELTATANDFVRIADKEKTQWLPYYYAGLATLQKGRMMMQQGKTSELDAIANEADQYIDKADALSPNNSEIYVLKKMNHGIRMMVNPQERWMTEGKAAMEALATAKKLDPTNPRITVLEAEDAYFTPEQFGGSKSKGIELFKKSLEMFKTFKPQSSLSPSWGDKEAQYFISQTK